MKFNKKDKVYCLLFGDGVVIDLLDPYYVKVIYKQKPLNFCYGIYTQRGDLVEMYQEFKNEKPEMIFSSPTRTQRVLYHSNHYIPQIHKIEQKQPFTKNNLTRK